MIAIGPFPILYTACRELPLTAGLGNCQGMLDSSGITTLPKARPVNDRFATRRVTNPIALALEATAEDSSVVHMRAMPSFEVSGYAVPDHFRGATKMIALGQTSKQ